MFGNLTTRLLKIFRRMKGAVEPVVSRDSSLASTGDGAALVPNFILQQVASRANSKRKNHEYLVKNYGIVPETGKEIMGSSSSSALDSLMIGPNELVVISRDSAPASTSSIVAFRRAFFLLPENAIA